MNALVSFFITSRQSFARKSQSTYGSFNTLNGGDDRNHGSAEVISSTMRDEDESEDAEMLNDSGGTSATTAPANDDNDDAADYDAAAAANKMDQDNTDDHDVPADNLISAERIDDDVEVFDPTNGPNNQEQRK